MPFSGSATVCSAASITLSNVVSMNQLQTHSSKAIININVNVFIIDI